MLSDCLSPRLLQSQQEACISRLVSKHHPPHPQHHPLQQQQHHQDQRAQSPYSHSLLHSPIPWSRRLLQQQQEQHRHSPLLNHSPHDPSVPQAHSSPGSAHHTAGSLLSSGESLADRLSAATRTEQRGSACLSPTGSVARKGEQRQDLTVQDIAGDDFDARSNHSQLESESIYLPLTETPPSPLPISPHPAGPQSRLPVSSHHQTTPPGYSSKSSPPLSSTVSSPAAVSSTPSPVVAARPQTSPESKYEWKERQVIRPLNQEIIKGKLKTNFPVTVPQASDAEPRTHTPRGDRPPTADSQDYDMSLDTSRHSPLPTPSSTSTSSPTTTTTAAATATSVPSAQISLIQRVANSKRSARLQQQQNMRHTPPPSGSGPSSSHIPTLGQQQQQQQQHQQQQQQQQVSKGGRSRVKGLDSNRQAELSKLVKCQQNADRLNQSRDRVAPGLQLSTDSGIVSRPSSDAVLTDCGQEGHTAATTIQALWRGYRARKADVDVVSVRKEIRARRAEDHIVLLRADLDRHKKLYNEEKRLRTLQMEAIRCLYHEIQQLKSQMQSQSSAPNSRPGTADSMLSSASATNLGQSHSCTCSTLNSDLQRTAELERTCQNLQSQVWELQQALQSMTSHVFRQDSMELNSLSSTPDTAADNLCQVQVLECHEGQIHSPHQDHQVSSCQWSSIPHSLSPYPSEEEETYFRQVPHHGAPTPPRNLGLQHKGEQSVLLHWLPSRLSIDHTSDPKPSVTGYRVYINDQPKGTISNHKTMAVVCGLYPSATYKFYVRAVSSFGESYESNIVIARLARGSERQRPTDSSDSDIPPDSDKDRDSSDVIDKRRLRNKREGRKHRKARSPRSEKKATKTGGEEGAESTGGREGGGGGQREGGETHHHHHHHQRESGENHQHQHHHHQSVENCVAGILTQAKLHKHLRKSSKEQGELSSLQSDSNASTPSRVGEDNQPSSRTTPPSCRSTPPPSRSTPTKELVGLAQPDVVRQRRAGSPARDLSFKSPSPSLERKGSDRSSPASHDREHRSAPTPPAMEDVPETPVVLSETFDVDQAKSFLRNLTTPPPSTPSDPPGSGDSQGGFVKGHQRKRSKDLGADVNAGTTHKDRSSPDRGSGTSHSEVQGGEEGVKIKTHRRTRSRELNTPTPMDDVREEGGGSREKERSNTPVLDARKRTSSRPSSPMIFEGPSLATEQREADSPLAELSRRKTIAENLVQRWRKSPSPSNTSGGREQEEGEKTSPQYGNRSRKQSPSSDSLPDSQEEMPRPQLLRHRTHSVGSESDLVCAGGDRKLYSSSILSKLDMLESNLSEKNRRLRKRSNEEESRKPPGRTRHVSESDDISSDPGSHLPPRAPVASDSSSGSHSDDSKRHHHYRHHRRSPSDQRPVTASGYSSDQVTGRATHSPIIMEGQGKKGSSGVRRNASFHALLPLPSRPHDSQPSPAPEEMASGGGVGSHREEVTSPQESQGNPRSSIRSRSPSPGPNRQPILSIAQLKRLTPEPAKPAS